MSVRISSDPPGKTLHRQPVPTCSRIGDMVFSSAISGMDTDTGEFSDDPETQIGHAFKNVKAAIEAAGGTLDHIGKVVVLLRERSMRDILNRYWVETFPNEKSRPVRHLAGTPGAKEMFVQLEFIAVVAN